MLTHGTDFDHKCMPRRILFSAPGRRGRHGSAIPLKGFMQPSNKFHLASLDGMRAAAAILVFFGHAGWGDVVPGGLGVTAFFFLSGYLITTLLRREYAATGGIDFKLFYLRRAYRILPPMYLVLLLILGLGLLGVVPHTATWPGVLAQSLQVTNYYMIVSGLPGLVYGTGIFWSLAVEEHFYLLFPLLLMFCLRRWRYAHVAGILLALALAVLLWRCVLVYGLHAPVERTYLASDTRIDSILFGCLMGLCCNPALDDAGARLGAGVKAAALGAAVSLLIFCLLARDAGFRETLRYTLQGLALLPIFWLAVRHPAWPVFAPLNWRPVVVMGKLSYTFYLSHFFFLKVGASLFQQQLVVALAAFGCSLLFAYLVHIFVEQPCARLRAGLPAAAAGGRRGQVRAADAP